MSHVHDTSFLHIKTRVFLGRVRLVSQYHREKAGSVAAGAPASVCAVW